VNFFAGTASTEVDLSRYASSYYMVRIELGDLNSIRKLWLLNKQQFIHKIKACSLIIIGFFVLTTLSK